METFSEIVDAVREDMGVDSGGTVATEEAVKRYVNLGHRKLARDITKLREDYFLTQVTLTPDSDPPLDKMVSEYNLPAGILLNKIRTVSYLTGHRYFTLEHLSLERYLWYLTDYQGSYSVPMGYYILQRPAPTPEPPEVVTPQSISKNKIIFLPVNALNNVDAIQIYYLRTPTNMVGDDDTPDIADSQDFLYHYCMHRIAITDPNYSGAADLHFKAMDDAHKDMLEIYTDRTPKDGGDLFRMDEESQLAGRDLSEFSDF